MQFDLSRWPIVVVTVSGDMDEDGLHALMEQGEALLARGEPHVIITDLRALHRPLDGGSRQTLADWATRMAEEYGETQVASIKIVRSAVVRGALTAFQWVRGRKATDRYVGTMEEAWIEALQACKEKGLPDPGRPQNSAGA